MLVQLDLIRICLTIILLLLYLHFDIILFFTGGSTFIRFYHHISCLFVFMKIILILWFFFLFCFRNQLLISFFLLLSALDWTQIPLCICFWKSIIAPLAASIISRIFDNKATTKWVFLHPKSIPKKKKYKKLLLDSIFLPRTSFR